MMFFILTPIVLMEKLAQNSELQDVVERLVDAYHPERIYLFGSAARGEAGPDSDCDVLVLM